MRTSTSSSQTSKWCASEFDSHATTMIIINKITGRDVSREYLALMQGIITRDEFELITLTIK